MYYASKQINIGNSNLKNDVNNIIYPELVIVPYPSKDKSQPTFQLLYNNKVFVNAKLSVHAPKEWSKEYKTDNNGVFSFNPICNGQYVIECIYKEDKAGTFKGKNYEATRHRATYTLIVNNVKQ